MWRAFLSALQFLTVLPVPSRSPFNAHAAIPYFPLIGLVIGFVLCLIDAAAMRLWNPSMAALLDVFALAVFTGSLHLDGLADTADGLYGHRTPEQTLAIMKDSRIGAMGMVAVWLCLAAKWAGIHGLDAQRAHALVLVPAYARAAVLFAIRFLPYGRRQEGTGHAFFQSPLKKSDFWAVVLVGLMSVILGAKAIALNLGFIVLVAATLGFYRKRMGCVTGDMLGAMIEVIETGLFITLAAGMRP